MRRWRILFVLAALAAASMSWAQYSGSYDVGGGNNDFASPQAAAAALVTDGMTGPVTLNVYTGVYSGQVTISAITGLDAANPLVIQNAAGQAPVIESPTGHGIHVNSADYVTIRGFEIRNCGTSAIRAESATDSVTHLTIENCYLHSAAMTSSAGVLYMHRTADCLVSGNRIEVTGSSSYLREALEVRFSDRDRFVNNMIASVYAQYATGMVVERDCDLNEWYFNSMCGIDAFAVFYESPQSARQHRNTFLNNIYYNGGTGSSTKLGFYLNGESAYLADLVSDYNVIFAIGVNSSEYGVAGFPWTMATWRSTSGLDMNSFRFHPNFASDVVPFDLHLKSGEPSIADNAGTPVVGITADNDGETRDVSTPDIGADERVMASVDALLGYVPLLVPQGCEGSSTTFEVDYLSHSNLPPTSPSLFLNNGFWAAMSDPGGDYTQGVRLTTTQVLPAGNHSHHFEAGALRLPFGAGEFAGPVIVPPMSGSFDIGGGAMDFAAITDAVALLKQCGMGGDVVLNIFDGTYSHTSNAMMQISSSSANATYYVPGLGMYNLTFQAASGQSPIVTTSGAVRAFYLNGASNVTIQGLTIACATGYPIYTDASGTTYPTDVVVRNNVISWSGSSSSGGIYARDTQNLLIEGNTIFVTGTVGGGIQVYQPRSGAVIRNNTVHAPRTSYYCAYHQGTSTGQATTEWYHNTFYANAASTCFYFTGLYPSIILKNNIFFQGGSGACLKTSTTTWACPTTSDYNVFRSSGNYAQNSTASIAYTFTEYQTACSGRDQNSLDCDPDFVYDGGILDSTLHINPTSCANGAGTPIAGVTVDRDGDARDGSNPDIGADEVGGAAPDAMLVHVGDHFCLHLTPDQEAVVYWCCPLDGPPFFSWLPGCEYSLPGCEEICPPYSGPMFWTAQLDSVSEDCPAPGGWWSARFTAQGEGCVCVYFEYQLSVELIDFAATAGEGNVTLTWATASENNNARFEVYRTTDGNWTRITSVPGQGTSTTRHDYRFMDTDVESGVIYSYRLAAADVNGSVEWVGSVVEATPLTGDAVPTEYALYQNYPNPFNPTTNIRFDVAERGWVTLKVYNPIGQEVATVASGEMNAGRYTVTFDANLLPSGMYLYRLEANDFSSTKKMLLMK